MEKIQTREENQALREAWDFVEHTGRSIFLTGKAGTGKTTFLKTVIERSKKRSIVVAPTGVAAINAGGVTIHSFFQLPFTPFVPNARIKSKFDFGKEKRRIIASLDLLIIDEISMVRSDLLDAIDSVPSAQRPCSRLNTSRYSWKRSTARRIIRLSMCSTIFVRRTLRPKTSPY